MYLVDSTEFHADGLSLEGTLTRTKISELDFNRAKGGSENSVLAAGLA